MFVFIASIVVAFWAGTKFSSSPAASPLNNNNNVDVDVVDQQQQQQHIQSSSSSSSNTQSLVMRIPFQIPPNHDFKKIHYENNYNVRQYLPNQDLFVKKITFVSAQVDESQDIPFHLDTYADKEETIIRDDVVYAHHHTSLHQGHQVGPMHKNIHDNAVLAYGTRPFTLDFQEYGIRLRPDTKVFACLHGLNRSPETKTFFSVWNIEYEVITEEEEGKKKKKDSLVVAFFYHFLMGAQVNQPYVVTTTFTAKKDLEIVGISYHHHPWAKSIDAISTFSGDTTTTPNTTTTATTNDNTPTIWSHDDTPSHEQFEPLPQSFSMKEGDVVTFIVHAMATFEGDLHTPLAISIFCSFPDGSDRIQEAPDEFFAMSQTRTEE